MFSSPSNTRTQKSSAFTPACSANRFEALEPVRQGVHRCFGSIAAGVARGLKLRHDHGSNYMSGDFQDEIKCLGIEASPSFVREPEGNGVAERFIRTLKKNLLWVRTFKTIEELRAELIAFAKRYNESLGSSRGMDTKRPRGSERSKPCHELQLTRRSQPPYPWPPEQAQPSVSKPCRTTPDQSDRSADNPQLGDTSAYQSPSTSQIILKIADDPVNHSFLNGTQPFETGSE